MTTYHIINLAGSVVYISTEVRREIEAWWRSLHFPEQRYETIVVQDIYDAEIIIVADSMNYIYESTPESREKSRAHDKIIKEEEVPGVD